MKRKGIMLGTRWRNGRQIYTYMFRCLFADILYKNDNPEEQAENFIMIPGLAELNEHFEKEIKSTR